MTDYTTVFEIDEEVVATAKMMLKCETTTKLHWSIFNDDDAIYPTQIANRAMTNFRYANGRSKNECPICTQLLTDDLKTYRDVNEWQRKVGIDEQKPKVPFNMTVIPDRREGVLNDTSESVIPS